MSTPAIITQDLHVEVRIGRRVHYERVDDWAAASRLADRIRRQKVEAGIAWRDLWILVLSAGRMHRVAKISMNGRVWAPRPWRQGDVPLYDPPQGA